MIVMYLFPRVYKYVAKRITSCELNVVGEALWKNVVWRMLLDKGVWQVMKQDWIYIGKAAPIMM